MIQVRGITKSFGRIRAVRGVTFEAAAGQVVGLLGANGAGKSTTIRIITGFLPPDAGSVRVRGHDTVEDSAAARRLIGYLPESAPAYGEMSVRGYLDFRGRLFGMRRSARRAAVERVLGRCWLADVAARRIGHLSKGYRQRVGLAAALLHDPPVVILDEPTNALDPAQIRETRRLIRELADERTVLVSSHILPEVEKTCDRVIILTRGAVRVDARPGELLEALRESAPYIVQAHAPGGPEAARRTLADAPGVAEASVVAPEDRDGSFSDEDAARGWAVLRVVGAAGAGDLRETIAAAAARSGMLVRELRREAPSLERVFLGLFDSEDPRPGAVGAARAPGAGEAA